MEDQLKAAREKNWNEIDETEKIERMRCEVKRLVRLLAKLTSKIDLLLSHRHDDRDIMVPINISQTELTGGYYPPFKKEGYDVYF
uniref:Uncharacterized protein n=1 Tax=viral metagenome TaxID=1070528 RepID=A0A6M3JBJ0_9ZZZZ